MPEQKRLTEMECYVVVMLNAKPFTVEYLNEWINRTDNVQINAPAALTACSAIGFYRAVRALAARMEADAKAESSNDSAGIHIDPPEQYHPCIDCPTDPNTCGVNGCKRTRRFDAARKAATP